MITSNLQKIINLLSPLVPTLVDVDIRIDNLKTQISATLIKAGYPDGIIRSISDQLVTYKLTHPEADKSQINSYIENNIVPQLDAKKTLNTTGKQNPKIDIELNNNLTNEDVFSIKPQTITQQTIQSQISKRTSTLASKEISTALMEIVPLAGAISDYSELGFKSAAFKDILTNYGLPYIQSLPNISTESKIAISEIIKELHDQENVSSLKKEFQVLKRELNEFSDPYSKNIDFTKILSIVEKQSSLTPQSTQYSDPSYYNSQPGEIHPFISYIFNNPVTAQAKNKIGDIAIKQFLSSSTGQKVSQFAIKTLGEETVKNALTKFGAKQVVKTAVTTAATKLGASALASVVGTPVLGVIVFIGTEILSRIKRIIQKHSRLFLSIGAGILGFFLFGSLAAAIATSALLFGALSSFSAVISGFGAGTGLGSLGVSSIGTRAGIIFNSLAGNFITDNIVPIIIGVLSLPVIIAFFLIIINSGAYIVPPSARHAGPGGLYPSCWPLDSGIITSLPPHGAYNTLDAFDIGTSGQNGLSVYATHDGVVHTYVDPNTPAQGSYGNYIKVVSAEGFCTLYGHLASFVASDGANVLAGDEIGKSDNTGTSTGPHLHYEYQEPCLVYAGNIAGDNRIINYVPSGWALGASIQYPGSCFASQQGGSNTGP